MVLCVADKEVNPLNDKRLTNGSLALNNKKVITIDAVKTLEEAKLRVAAYARVSSDSTDQLNSFVAQTTHYISLISSNENWTLVDIYADEGITGSQFGLSTATPRVFFLVCSKHICDIDFRIRHKSQFQSAHILRCSRLVQ